MNMCSCGLAMRAVIVGANAYYTCEHCDKPCDTGERFGCSFCRRSRVSDNYKR